MRICFIADANSIHARRWIEYFCRPSNDIVVLSTVRDPEPIAGARVYDLHRNTVTAAGDRSTVGASEKLQNGESSTLMRAARSIYENESVWAARDLYRTFRLAGRAGPIIRELQPNLVHCLRLPIEGYIGGLVGYSPLVVSSWGSDLVFFAKRYLPFRWLTRKALKRADVHFTDNGRDKRLAEAYGFSPAKPTVEVPGGGGLKRDEVSAHVRDESVRAKIGVARDTNLLLSPRGFVSPFTNTRALLLALPPVVERFPDTVCLFIGDTRSPGYLKLKALAKALKIEEHCRFVHRLKHAEFLDYMAASDVMISPSLSDGLPNSMLEAMACGAIPVMSRRCPVEDWITHGWNGYFFDPVDPPDVARVVIEALGNKAGFEVMRQRNRQIVAERGDYDTNMKRVEEIYCELIARTSPTSRCSPLH